MIIHHLLESLDLLTGWQRGYLLHLDTDEFLLLLLNFHLFGHGCLQTHEQWVETLVCTPTLLGILGIQQLVLLGNEFPCLCLIQHQPQSDEQLFGPNLHVVDDPLFIMPLAQRQLSQAQRRIGFLSILNLDLEYIIDGVYSEFVGTVEGELPHVDHLGFPHGSLVSADVDHVQLRILREVPRYQGVHNIVLVERDLENECLEE